MQEQLRACDFIAGKTASPVVYDVKQSKSVADASAVEGPALSVDEPSEQLKSVAVFTALPVSASQRARQPAPWFMM